MSSTAAQRIPVVGAVAGTTVELVPGKKYQPLELDAVAPVAIAELIPAGGGTYRVQARICSQWFSVAQRDLRRLGIGISTSGMRRLGTAGFVVMRQVTLGIYQFDYHSYREHEARTADPEFWDRTETGHRKTNRQRYSEAI